MRSSNPLLSACYSIPADKKRRIISQIGEVYVDGRGNAYRNAVTINNWLVDNHFDAAPTLENIEGFIEEHFRQEEFFDERRPVDDDTEELAELERVRDEINQRIEELRDRIQEQNATDSIPDTLPDAPQPPSPEPAPQRGSPILPQRGVIFSHFAPLSWQSTLCSWDRKERLRYSVSSGAGHTVMGIGYFW